jgi:hypothetical protein
MSSSDAESVERRAWLDMYTRRQIDLFMGHLELGDYFQAIVALERLQEWMKHYD